MTAPNIVQVSTIIGKTAALNLTTANATSVLSNPAASDLVLKINSIVLSNIDGASAVTATVAINDQAAGAGADRSIIQGAEIGIGQSLVVTDKSIAFYLVENTSIVVTAGGANDIAVIISYEEISD